MLNFTNQKGETISEPTAVQIEEQLKLYPCGCLNTLDNQYAFSFSEGQLIVEALNGGIMPQIVLEVISIFN